MAGLARVKTSKGLLLILSLLCLVHIATSLIDKDTLTMLKKKLRKETEDLKKMKADYEKRVADASKQLNEGKKQLVAIEEIVKEMSDDFPPALQLPKIVKRFFENTKAFMDRTNHGYAVNLKEREMQLKELRHLVKLQEQQVEL